MNQAFFNLPEEKQQRILESGIGEFSMKSYSEASTEQITKSSGISKGLLFHYFASKKEFYLFCLERSFLRLMQKTECCVEGDFYEVIFSCLNEKIQLCRKYPKEMHMVNMASRETYVGIEDEKKRLMERYMTEGKKASLDIYKKALSKLSIKDANNSKILEALMLYTTAILNKYLTIYQSTPDNFFMKIEEIKQEVREYLDYMLKGII